MGISYLIDTHILLWWLFDDPKLNAQCRDIIRNPDFNIIVSTISAWEIATKYRIGKLPEAKQIVGEYANPPPIAIYRTSYKFSPCPSRWQPAYSPPRSV